MAILSINAAGEPLLLDDRPVPLGALETELKSILNNNTEISIRVQIDRATIFDAVAKVMASAQRSGTARLSLVTLQQ